MVYNQAVSQNNCELDVIGPIRTADYEVNDNLPVLTPPDPIPGILSIPERRMVYFIHGLNGSSSSWGNAKAAARLKYNDYNYPGYEVITFAPHYGPIGNDPIGFQTSIETAVSEVESQLISFNPVGNLLPDEYDYTRGIAIAHSQGGIVARGLDMKWSKKNNSGNFIHGDFRTFGGIITVATPNRGAQILNNKNLILGLVHDLADDLTEGPYREFRNSDSYFVELMASLVNLPEVRDSIVRFISNNVGSFLITENMPPITDEYTVPDGSVESLDSKIEDINGYDPLFYDQGQDKEVQTSKVAFYAVGDLIKKYYNETIDEIVGWEDDPYISVPIWEKRNIPEIIVPISWGTIHFQLKAFLPNKYPTFEADDEDYLTAYRAHQTKHFYDSKSLQNEMARQRYRAKEINTGWGLNPLYFHYRYKRQQATKRRDAWNKGSVKLSKFDELYRIVIGARYAETVTHTSPNAIVDCKCYLPNGDEITYDCVMIEVYYPEATDCEEIYAGSQTVTYIVWHNKDSDGVVLVESQRDIEQNTWEPQKLEGVTHMQVRNSKRTAEMMKTVFSGGVGPFFITDEIED